MGNTRRGARTALLLAAVLAFTSLATPTAVAATEPCAAPTGDVFATGPSTLYGFVGVPLAPATFGTTTVDPVTWRGDCLPLPDGISFDPTSISYVGTPTTAQNVTVELRATTGVDVAYWDATLQILPAAALDLAITDASGTPLDRADIARGISFEFRGSGLPGGTHVDVELDGAAVTDGEVTDAGLLILPGTMPNTASRGAHTFRIDFTVPSGQRYAAELTVTVRALEVTGPAELTPVAGTPVDYEFPATDATGPVTYTLTGTLPAGLTFDAIRGAITGTPTGPSASRALQLTATDARGSATHDLTVAVLETATVIPDLSVAPLLDGMPAQLADWSGRGLTAEQALDEFLGRLNAGSADVAELGLTFDPTTGEASFFPIHTPSDLTDPPTADTLRELLIGSVIAGNNLLLADIASTAEASAATFDAEANLARLDFAAVMAERLLAEQDPRLGQPGYADLDQDLTRLRAQEQRLQQLIQQVTALEEQARQLVDAANDRISTSSEPRPLPVGTVIIVELHSTPVRLGSATVGTSGGFALRVAAPSSVTPGKHHLVVTYRFPDGTVHTSSTPVTVLAARRLPPTGFDVGPTALVATGLLALAAGLGLTRAAARSPRRARAATSAV
jgi:Uncharacterized protein conserved in bacteria with the myosin-like domain